MLVLEVLNQMDQIGIFDLLRHQQVALVQLFHCTYPGDGEVGDRTQFPLLLKGANALHGPWARISVGCGPPPTRPLACPALPLGTWLWTHGA